MTGYYKNLENSIEKIKIYLEDKTDIKNILNNFFEIYKINNNKNFKFYCFLKVFK
jgi:hypothetical protein